MPELPEVETMRRGILAIEKGVIERAERTPCKKRPIHIVPRIDRLNRRVAGKRIESVDRLGKRVVLRLENDDRLIFEPRMTGLVLVGKPPGPEHLRFCLHLEECEFDRLLFWDRRGLGRIELLTAKQYESKLNDGSLGPDAIGVSLEQFRERFKKTRREIKVAMLDQSIVAGIGNLYASEILHLSGVHPQATCDRLKPKQWSRIYRNMIDVFTEAIKYEGSTLSDGTYRTALNDPGEYQNHHRVYDRENERCHKCKKTKIKRIVQAQRSTFFCAKCQKKTCV